MIPKGSNTPDGCWNSALCFHSNQNKWWTVKKQQQQPKNYIKNALVCLENDCTRHITRWSDTKCDNWSHGDQTENEVCLGILTGDLFWEGTIKRHDKSKQKTFSCLSVFFGGKNKQKTKNKKQKNTKKHTKQNCYSLFQVKYIIGASLFRRRGTGPLCQVRNTRGERETDVQRKQTRTTVTLVLKTQGRLWRG